jgi:hypothetical protein
MITFVILFAAENKRLKKEKKGGTLPLSLSVCHWVEAPSSLASPCS